MTSEVQKEVCLYLNDKAFDLAMFLKKEYGLAVDVYIMVEKDLEKFAEGSYEL